MSPRLPEGLSERLEAARGTRTPRSAPRARERHGSTSAMGATALALAERGLAVHPLRPKAKEPLTPHGFRDATRDPATIRRWWVDWPTANPGIACGASEVLVLDEDLLNELKRLCEEHGQPLPRTYTVRTSKGRHFWFKQPEGEPIGNVGSLRKAGYQIDVRGQGGYVVGPGSVHPDGGEYTVEDDSEIAELPDWLLSLLRPEPEHKTGISPPVSTQAAGSESPLTESGAHAALDSACSDLINAPEGTRNPTLNDKAYRLGRMVAAGLLDEQKVRDRLTAAAAAAGLTGDEVRKTLDSAMTAASKKPREVAPDRVHLDDSRLAEHTAAALRDRYCWSGGMGWLAYDGKVWKATTDAAVTEAVRQVFTDTIRAEAANADADRIKRLSALRTVSKIRAVVALLRGILEVRADEFDRHPDLLNVNNGVIDLATGTLHPHDAALRLTKVTSVNYTPGARSADWRKALQALPAEVADWLQVRFGQAATGHMTSDDVMPVLQGNGSNGKSTIVEAIRAALGDHAVIVPERVLLANPSDHPTELTTLHGARLALIEETPEGRRLSVKRLKDTLGTPTLTARKIQRDNVTWQATHSLFLTSNYRPRVHETDHGTWRRLALVRFPYSFRRPGEPTRSEWDREGDPRLRERLRHGKQGQREAVLAWVVEGARRWYEADQVLPPQPEQVLRDTEAWRAGADLVLAFVNECLRFDARSKVLSSDLFEQFTSWVVDHGQEPWGEVLFSDRFGNHDEVAAHDVRKVRTKSLGGLTDPQGRPIRRPSQTKERVWVGLRFRQATADDTTQSELDGLGGQP